MLFLYLVASPYISVVYSYTISKTEEGFRQLYLDFAPILYGIIRQMVRDPISAQDVLQEVFMKVWNRSHLFESGKGTLFTWLYTITRHTAIDHNRYESKHEFEFVDFSTSTNGPSVKAMNTDTIYLSRSVHSLPRILRPVVEKSFYQGLTVREIAQELNIPEGTVKTRMRAALKHLRQQHETRKTIVGLN